ncbi:hypothetical protein CCR75_002633 [Bremia lactucae]|uniref:WRKY19-like zinc finger domain-containing protein n=1 Tax=Bremia lactucae TaxID=4779 RepID=A0A976IKV9_BRELC|nr:hypothetical protein CCR75_002633 [Bremia lactucae]
MQASAVEYACLEPLLQAALNPPTSISCPCTIRTIRLPSLTPRLPALPSLMNTLTAHGGSADLSLTRASSSISFLLNPPVSQAADAYVLNSHQHQLYAQSASYTILSYSSFPSSLASTTRRMQPQEITTQLKRKRKTRICKFEGCEKYVVDRGLCIRHGGGKRCSVAGCDCRAQNRGLCWKHGGYTRCTVKGCTKRAKSRGICWSHGGGTRCKHGECAKIAVSHGLCWAHGGDKRCLIDLCRKPAYERNGNLCAEHCAQQQASTRDLTAIQWFCLKYT